MSKIIFSKNFEDQLLYALKQKQKEVCYVSVQDVGVLTNWYKKITKPFKISPWKILLPISFSLAIFGQLFLGGWSVKVVSVLQSAF